MDRQQFSHFLGWATFAFFKFLQRGDGAADAICQFGLGEVKDVTTLFDPLAEQLIRVHAGVCASFCASSCVCRVVERKDNV